MLLSDQLQQAAKVVEQGGVIAYPTEGVYGLGCSPSNEAAVQELLAMKQRSIKKGLILVANDFAQVEHFTHPLDSEKLAPIFRTWPGPTTWVFPASEQAPYWITGEHDSIAIRISAFKLIQQLCALIGPLVSTSANIAGHPAAQDAAEVGQIFADTSVFVVDAPLGGLTKPTSIYDARTGKNLRD